MSSYSLGLLFQRHQNRSQEIIGYLVSFQSVEHIYKRLLDKNYCVEGVKFVLISGHKEMFTIVIKELARHDQVSIQEHDF